MKVLILNSGKGTRMGSITKKQPKCMTYITKEDTILSRQLRLFNEVGIREVVITTGPFHKELMEYCDSLDLDIEYTFINNKLYDETNYIYSIYLAKNDVIDDVILVHGDLIFDKELLVRVVNESVSCMTVDSKATLPEKDFKAVINYNNGKMKIHKIGVEFFHNAVAAQPLYKLKKKDWKIWLDEIELFCKAQKVNCYAENAFNSASDVINLYGLEIGCSLCGEVDNVDDLNLMKKKLLDEVAKKNKTVYMCFSTDIIHGGHISIIEKASELGNVIIGVLSDEAVASYKRYPILSATERTKIIESINGVKKVIEQKELSYLDVISDLKPDYVVHGVGWKNGIQRSIRDEVITALQEYGGLLVEYPDSINENYDVLERHARQQLSMPDVRRGRLRKLLKMKGMVNAIEAHSGITGLIAEKTVVEKEGKTYQFDAMWVSSLCDSTVKGKPDIELVDMSSRLRTIDDIMEVTTKPIIVDGDTGGLMEHFAYTVRTLERLGVSAVIIEDKTGLKRNSLFGTEVEQTQDSISNFCAKIAVGKKVQKTKEFMIIARIESLILDRGMEDALNRAFAYIEAGADGIMIHSRKIEPTEIFDFIELFRKKDSYTPLVVVPTSFNSVTEAEFKEKGVNIIIYANQLTRSGLPAMQKAAELILENHRAKEADEICMSIKDILTLIPEEQ